MDLNEKIAKQREQIAKGNPKIELLSSCRIGDGIAVMGQQEKLEAKSYFLDLLPSLAVTFFIPSSGSGSRMFGAAYDFMHNPDPGEESIEFVEHLINSISDFAFYNKLSSKTKQDLESGDIEIETFLRQLLTPEGFDFGNRPKGLIPFHRYGNFIINPFQEHILQGSDISGEGARFHFTINPVFENEIRHSLKILHEITGQDFHFEFSEQDPTTNAIAFSEEGEVIHDENGELITRPSGHGALIQNLNKIDADLILIRNIDNIQHQNNASVSTEERQILAGKLLIFQKAVHSLLKKLDEGVAVEKEVKELNKKYNLGWDSVNFEDKDLVKPLLDRPIRICGMVRNQGQPGGGPFWVKSADGIRSRQIVEKSQISNTSSQLMLLVKSTHFNPVEIICAPKNYLGEKFDLENYRDGSQYFIVNKTHKEKSVRFIEQPGLWNGGMANWITLFYEISNDCFSPVKTVLDLLKSPHLSK